MAGTGAGLSGFGSSFLAGAGAASGSMDSVVMSDSVLSSFCSFSDFSRFARWISPVLSRFCCHATSMSPTSAFSTTSFIFLPASPNSSSPMSRPMPRAVSSWPTISAAYSSRCIASILISACSSATFSPTSASILAMVASIPISDAQIRSRSRLRAAYSAANWLSDPLASSS